jgi:hypothetical protein
MLTPNELQRYLRMTGVDGSQEDGVEVEADDSTDGGVLVNGNDGEEHWGRNK